MFFFKNEVLGFIFYYFCSSKCIVYGRWVYMKKILKYVRLIAALALITTINSGCFRQDYMFEDGDFDGIEFSDYDLMHNAELDMDDVDRN